MGGTTGEQGRRGVAAAVVVTAWGLAAAAGVLTGVAGGPWTTDRWYLVVDVADAVVYGLVAGVVLSRRSHPVAWLVALTAVGGGVAAVAAPLGELATPDGARVAPSWAVLQNVAWVPGTLALVLVVPYLVSAERPGRAARTAVLAGVGVTAAVVAVRLTDPWPWPDGGEPFAPLAVRHEAWVRLADPTLRWLFAAVAVLGLLAAGHAALRRRRNPAARGLGWLAIGTALIAVTFLPLAVRPDGTERAVVLFTPLAHLASQAFFPAAVLVAVLRQRLWGIDLAVSRTLVWSLLTGMLVGGYVLVVAVLGLALPEDGTAVRVVATAALAAGTQPARGWLQRRVDRLVHGEGTAPTLSRVGRHLGSAANDEEALTGMAASLAGSLNLGSVRVLDVRGEPLAAVADPSGHGTDGIEMPLMVRGRLVGTLSVTARPGERFDRRARTSLEEVAQVVATAVHLAAVTRALRESRDRLAAARDDERRALRRELHDRIGPALAGIGLGLAAARNLLPDGSDAAGALLVRLRAEAEACAEDVRVLARDLVPPVLAELGLAGAVKELVMRYEADGLAVTVRDDGVGDVPPRVAGAAYAIVAEAVRNVARHAGARTCAVELAGGRMLTAVVEDDGCGMGGELRPGVGTSSARERAEEVGGTVEWGPGAGGRGTRVVLRVPLRAATKERGNCHGHRHGHGHGHGSGAGR
ncbi:sensor histidine kinase [Streptomyces glaucus]|uniref:sensor histidine kinase n=1 Tax=Streptomyces glaucus TaxID=284029 RepID=UPI0031E11AF6